MTDEAKANLKDLELKINAKTESTKKAIAEEFNNIENSIKNKKEKKDNANVEVIKKEILKKTAKGSFTQQDADAILDLLKRQYQGKHLTEDDIHEIDSYLQKTVTKYSNNTKVPVIAKVFAVLNLCTILLLVPEIINVCVSLVNFFKTGMVAESPSSIAPIMLCLCALFALCTYSFQIVTTVMILKKKPATAGIWLRWAIVATVLGGLCYFSVYGFPETILLWIAYLVFLIILASYLHPSLKAERHLQFQIKQLDTEKRAEEGRLGLKDDQSKGYIKLDFFNIFWIFVVCSIIGLIAEYIFHIFFVWEPGVFKDRAGMLWGPFSPIYGFGAVIMTICLNRFKNINPFLLFAICTVIGGAFEYFVSWFLEVSFSVQAWDYSNNFLNINGRTCLSFACMFGAMGFVWIKWALPAMMKLINKFPWKWRYGVTAVFATFMIINGIMTLQALNCWYARVSGYVGETPIEQFYAKYFDNETMANRFESMTIVTDKQPDTSFSDQNNSESEIADRNDSADTDGVNSENNTKN